MNRKIKINPATDMYEDVVECTISEFVTMCSCLCGDSHDEFIGKIETYIESKL